jgi:uncharacterized protein YecE (DUF72 family)
MTVFVGCAGWSLPREIWPDFSARGSQLERYAARLSAVEINSSFYHPHGAETYARWAAGVPPGFRFSVKVPMTITHERWLVGVERELEAFLGQVAGLGDRLGCLLLQLPPSLAFDRTEAGAFFALLRGRYPGPVACEARHSSWFGAAPEGLLEEARIAGVVADPAPVAAGRVPHGWPGLVYYRMHGSPVRYYSPYDGDALDALANHLGGPERSGIPSWCIFDNSALGAAPRNALDLAARLRDPDRNSAEDGEMALNQEGEPL